MLSRRLMLSFISLQGFILATLHLLAAKGQDVEFRYNFASKRLGGYRCGSDKAPRACAMACASDDVFSASRGRPGQVQCEFQCVMLESLKRV